MIQLLESYSCIIFLAVFIFLLNYFIDFSLVNAQVDLSRDSNRVDTLEYVPLIIDLKRIPQYPTQADEVSMYVRILDSYGKIQHVELLFSNDNGITWKNNTMKMINGISSNGTFYGKIPPQKENSTIIFTFLITDDLGYSFNGKHGPNNVEKPSNGVFPFDVLGEDEYTVRNIRVSKIEPNYDVIPDKAINLTAQVQGYNIKNVTLYYFPTNKTSINANLETTGLKNDYIKVAMKPSQKLDIISGEGYVGVIPPFHAGTVVSYYVIAFASNGHFDRSRIDNYYLEGFSKEEQKILNNFSIAIKTLNVDAKNQTAKISVRFNSSLIYMPNIPNTVRRYDSEINFQITLIGFILATNQISDIFGIRLKSGDTDRPATVSLENKEMIRASLRLSYMAIL